MNYDKIILELMSRIQSLEEEVVKIKTQLVSRSDDLETEEDELDKVQGEYTRLEARNKAMKIIESIFPDYLAEKASRREGSGIKILRPDVDSKRPLIIKFFHSKTYEDRSGEFEHAWHTVNIADILGTIFDYCMFSVVNSKGEWSFLLYEPDELAIYNEENRLTKSDVLHLYFVIKDEKAFEVREKTIDVSDHLNNWNVLK